jgi:hypothetical protein
MQPDDFVKQLENLLETFRKMQEKSKHADLGDLPKPERQSLIIRSIASIHRVTGTNSTYSNEVERLLKQYIHLHHYTTSVMGVVQALKDDLEAGYLDTLTKLAQADIFSDFLEMGEYLLTEGYKDAAAVIIGGVLEDTLRKIAEKNGISIKNEKGKSLTIEPLNTELAKNTVYDKLTQKQITSWADLRNNAAHGHYDKFDKKQVEMMLLFVQSFCSNNL